MKTLDHPYINLTGGAWLKGNLHTHTTRSDGARPPQEVIDDYAARSYGFLMISDHDIYTGPQDYKQWDARGMVMIPGNEVTANGPHLLHVGADRFVSPAALRQQVINDIALGDGGGFAVINHPNWQERFDHCSIAQMREWVGYLGMEIFNGTIGRLHGSPYATNKWDMLLAEGFNPGSAYVPGTPPGRANGARQPRKVWGFANDDSHLPVEDVGLGWNMAYVTPGSPGNGGRATVSDVMDSLRTGRFYPSTGVIIESIEVEGLHIRVKTQNAQRIVALRQVGRRIAIADSNAIEITVPDEATYVRFECWGPGESFAWTQPFWVVEA